MHIENLCIEVTRRCNMRCAHCLRGNAQRLDIDNQAISEMLLHCKDGIGSLTFTGGEPTLNLDAISHTFLTIQINQIPLGSFYVVTNGHVFRQRLVDLLDDMYQYCDEKDMCGLAISDDEFHDEFHSCSFNSNFYRYRYDEYDCEREYFRPKDKKTKWHQVMLIDEGRAKELTSYKKRELTDSPYVEDHVHKGHDSIGGTLYLNAKGYLIDGCDWSYASQEHKAIAHVTEWDKFLSKLPSVAESICI